MEVNRKKYTSNTHQEKAKKLRKLRRWQIVVSLLGVAIVVWGNNRGCLSLPQLQSHRNQQ